MNAIEVVNLTKQYGRFEALRGVNLTVPKGAVFGLLGPNGAGKSTLIKALVGALRPSGGSLRVLGLDPLGDKATLRAQIGYMPQSPALYDDLSTRDNVRFFGSAHGIANLEQRIEEVIEFSELTSRANDPVYAFSGGMKKRASLACALVHSPHMLFLDEPTAAIDPQLKVRSWQLFRELASQGVTLFISTHLMDEALLCDQLAILQRGRIIALDTPQGLIQRGQTRLKLRRGAEVIEQQIGSTPNDLAAALYPYGLEASVSNVTLDADSLETIVLAMVKEEQP